MPILAAVAGTILILIVLGDAFETIILPRRVVRKIRLTRIFYHYAWSAWAAIANHMPSGQRRENYLSFFGPLSLIILLSLWAGGLIAGFAMIFWATGADEAGPNRLSGLSRFAADIYISGGNFFTLGVEDLRTRTPLIKVLTLIEGGLGFGFLAMIISYLPAINQAFSRREINISMLDAHAGSPPTAFAVLIRHRHDMDALKQILFEWERWASELMESQLSYPMLAHFRSQHDNQSWLSALTVILDTSALILTGLEGPCNLQARMTFAMARHAIVDLSIVFGKAPRKTPQDRLAREDLISMLDRLEKSGLHLHATPEILQEIPDLRNSYEPYLFSLADFHCLKIPPWVLESEYPDNWQKSAWETSAWIRKKGPPDTEEHF